jgi:hypothetical protein
VAKERKNDRIEKKGVEPIRENMSVKLGMLDRPLLSMLQSGLTLTFLPR